MAKIPGDPVETPIWDTYAELIKPYTDERPVEIERFAFYERAKKAYAVVMTGESALYANIIIKKGVVTE
jgi:L-fucose mutarotase